MDESHALTDDVADASSDGLLALYHAQIRDVYGFVFRRCGGDVRLAEDITQDIFVAAARQTRSTSVVPPPAWLYQTGRNRLIDHWRRQARTEKKLRLVAGGRSDAPTEDPAEAVVSGRRVAAALGELPTAQQAALLLRYLEGYSTKEVAEALDRSLKATESLLARARQRLEKTYGEQDYE